jgi:hypothetical protein
MISTSSPTAARSAAKCSKAVGRHAERFPRQVPERDVDAGQCRLQHGATAPERAPEDVLPYVLDPRRVLTDQHGLQMIQGANHGE